MIKSCPIARIIKRDGSVVRYDRSRIANAIAKAVASEGAANPLLAEAMAEKVETALASAYGSAVTPSVEDIQDVVESVLMENRLARVARSYIIYRHQHAMARAARAYDFEVTDNVPYKAIYEVLRWNMEHSCESLPALNRIIARGEFPSLVAEADRRYALEIERAAEQILERRNRARIVVVAGPSSSGKTTTTIKLSERLGRAGIGFKAINIDHYFFDLNRHPRDEFGDYDYEIPQALDLALINRHLVRLLDGQAVKTPHYDFKVGSRIPEAHEIKLEKNEILLIDSLHGLFGPMTESVPADYKFKVYIETLGQFRVENGVFMRWADNRLLRRMVRDKDHRNLKPMATLTHWHYVRKSEIENIIPYIKHADVIINSALPYELPILKRRLFRHFVGGIHAYRDDPKRLDAHIRVNRVYALLKPLRPVRDESCIPSDSLLREFIGGSRYQY
ncbi:MAG: ATP cone domain-containing protein [Verrucomicrobiota bacterium]|nr:ATP cone domain-containing protein [Verrucomicrobiota bacterium]